MKCYKKSPRANASRGFTLIELAIVLGVISAIIGGIWSYTTSVQQTANVEQSAETVSTLVDATRTAYASYSSAAGVGIYGGISIVVPQLISEGAMPSYLLRTTQTTCAGVPGNYADTPFGTNATLSACGSLGVCAWRYGVNAFCDTTAVPGTAQQYFAVEFSSLDFKSCVALVEQITPTHPTTGLKDIYINTTPSNNLGGLPIPPTAAMSNGAFAGLGCTPNSVTNKVDFVYFLHAPSS